MGAHPGCLTGFEPATFRSTAGRSAAELQAPRHAEEFTADGWLVQEISEASVRRAPLFRNQSR